MRTTGIISVATGAFLISFSPVFVTLAHVGPTAAGVYRMLFGGLALWLVALARREPLWAGRRAFGMAAACGILFALDIIFWHHSIHYVGPGLSTILANFQVFFLAAFGIVLLGERSGWRLWVAIPLAIAGLFLLVGVRWTEVDATYRVGVGLALLTAVTYSTYLLTLRHMQAVGGALSPVVSVATLSLITALVLIPSAIAQGESLTIPDGHSWVVLLGYGLLAHAAGWALISRGLPHVPASRAGLLLLVQPSLAFVWDIVLFGRPTTAHEAAGAVVALGAIYLGTSAGKRER